MLFYYLILFKIFIFLPTALTAAELHQESDQFSALPPELKVKIFSTISFEELNNIKTTSKHFYNFYEQKLQKIDPRKYEILQIYKGKKLWSKNYTETLPSLSFANPIILFALSNIIPFFNTVPPQNIISGCIYAVLNYGLNQSISSSIIRPLWGIECITIVYKFFLTYYLSTQTVYTEKDRILLKSNNLKNIKNIEELCTSHRNDQKYSRLYLATLGIFTVLLGYELYQCPNDFCLFSLLLCGSVWRDCIVNKLTVETCGNYYTKNLYIIQREGGFGAEKFNKSHLNPWKKTIFYPYTKKGVQQVTYIKIINIFIFLLKLGSYLYVIPKLKDFFNTMQIQAKTRKIKEKAIADFALFKKILHKRERLDIFRNLLSCNVHDSLLNLILKQLYTF